MGKIAQLLLFSLFFTAPAYAATGGSGFMVGLSYISLAESYDGTTFGTSEISRMVADVKMGMVMTSGLYVGGIYDTRIDENTGSKQERIAFGATIGYHNGGWFLDGSVFLDSTLKLSSSTKLEKGTGFGIDLGRNFDITTNTYAGLQFSYKSISYTQVNGAEVSNKLKSETCPMLNVGVMF